MSQPRIGIIVAERPDLPVMERAADLLRDLDVAHTLDVMSAHRSPAEVSRWAAGAKAAGYQVLIAGAGGAAHLPGAVAAHTPLPVIGVPCLSDQLGGADALYSTVQMPPGVPVASVGIDAARNAAILAVQILALSDPELADRLERLREEQATRDTEHREHPGGEGDDGFGFQGSRA